MNMPRPVLALILSVLVASACVSGTPYLPEPSEGGSTAAGTTHGTAPGGPAVNRLTIGGRVTVTGQEPSSDLTVSAIPVLAPPGGTVYGTRTAADGTFTISVPAGTYNVVAGKVGTAWRAVRWSVQAGENVNLALVPTGEIAGAVSAAGNQDLTGTAVFVPGTDLVAYTDAAGAYRLTGVPVGTYTLAVRGPAFALARSTDLVVKAGAVTSAAAISLVPLGGGTGAGQGGTGAVTGVLSTDDLGSPSGFSVQARARDGENASTTSASDGTFTLSGLPLTYVHLTFTRDRYAPLELDVPVYAGTGVQVPPVTMRRVYKVMTIAGGDLGYEDFDYIYGSVCVADGQGALYVADRSQIRKVVLATGVVSTVAGSSSSGFADGVGTAAQFWAPQGLALDGQGALYVADMENKSIRKVVLATGEVSTVAGSFSSGFADGVGTAAKFSGPSGLALDGQGALYVADSGNNRIRKLVLATGVVSTVAGSSSAGFADGVGTAAQFNRPIGMALDGQGALYVADSGNHRIRKVMLATGAVSTVAGSTQGFADEVGSAAKFSGPSGLALDGQGALYVADYSNNRIRKVVLAIGDVSTVAGSTQQGRADGVGTAAWFSNPNSLALVGQGTLYVAGREIRKVDVATGTVSTPLFRVAASMNGPTACLADGQGMLYVADGARIRKVVLATGAVSTVAGSVYGIADGVGPAAMFSFSSSLVLDGQGALYVADSHNHSIRRVVLATGAVSTVAGSTRGFADGVGTAAQFNSPIGMALDGQGVLYVADSKNHRIRKVMLATGAVSTVAGSTQGFADEVGSAAKFSGPSGLALDGQGALYVADRDRIRRVELASGAVITVKGTGIREGIAGEALFNEIRGLAVSKSGVIFLINYDTNGNKCLIFKFDPISGRLRTVAPKPPIDAFNDGSWASLNYPAGLTVAPDGDVIFGDVLFGDTRHTLLRIH
jgi:sugar lactone lactonase YvrE